MSCPAKEICTWQRAYHLTYEWHILDWICESFKWNVINQPYPHVAYKDIFVHLQASKSLIIQYVFWSSSTYYEVLTSQRTLRLKAWALQERKIILCLVALFHKSILFVISTNAIKFSHQNNLIFVDDVFLKSYFKMYWKIIWMLSLHGVSQLLFCDKCSGMYTQVASLPMIIILGQN